MEEELSIGQEGGGDYLFSQIRYLEVDEDENIYIADIKEMQVKVFDKKGQFIRALGSAGQGPGEIGRISGMQIIANKKLVIVDASQRKIIHFSLNGEFMHEKNIGKIWPLRVYCDSLENYYILTAVLEPPDSRYEIIKYDSDLNFVAKVRECPASDPTKPSNPFMPIFYYQVLKNDNLLYGFPETYELQIINPEGEVIKKINRDYDPILISEEEKESRKSEILKMLPDRKIEMPRHQPAYRFFAVDDEGRIYVGTWEKPKTGEGYVYDIFDAEGKYIAKVDFPFGVQVWKRGKVYTIKEDEEGFQMVKRYKVTWNY